MRAARYHGNRDVRVEDVAAPSPAECKVLVQVEWCGICGSDLNEYAQGPFATPIPARGTHPLTGDPGPVILGHEFSGRIAHAPANSGFKTGQLVVVDPRLNCYDCGACGRDAAQLCKTPGFLGYSGGGGGLSELVAVDPRKVHVLPDGTDLAAAALIEPLAVAWHAIKALGVKDFAGKPVLVIGGGPVGIASVFVLRAFGADKVILSEPASARRDFLGDLVMASVNPLEVNVAQTVKDLTAGAGVEFVVDCAGAHVGFVAGCDSLRYRGVYANLALPKIDVDHSHCSNGSAPLLTICTAPTAKISFITKELTYRAFLAYGDKDFAETVEAFVTGRFQGVEKMITSRLALKDIVEKGFEVLLSSSGTEIKIIVSP